MLSILDKIPYVFLIVIAIFMLLAPFHPMPHVIEKLIMLKNGSIKKPIDIFDLVFHLSPLVLLILKKVKVRPWLDLTQKMRLRRIIALWRRRLGGPAVMSQKNIVLSNLNVGRTTV